MVGALGSRDDLPSGRPSYREASRGAGAGVYSQGGGVPREAQEDSEVLRRDDILSLFY
jgi:hypothetical protein